MPDVYSEEFRTRLMKFHQEVLDVALQHEDFPLSIDYETAADLSEFLATFLYD